jgi:hypothetical protein
MPLRHVPRLFCLYVIACKPRQCKSTTMVVSDTERVTRAQLTSAPALADRELGPDDEVAQLMLNALDTSVTFSGALRAGRCVVISDP